ncbi:hypothetical protein [Streptomyces sp. NPDC000888]
MGAVAREEVQRGKGVHAGGDDAQAVPLGHRPRVVTTVVPLAIREGSTTGDGVYALTADALGPLLTDAGLDGT